MILFMSVFIIVALIGIAINCSKQHIFITLGQGKAKIDLERLYLVISITVMFLLCALRDGSIGVDTETYLDTFLYQDILMSTVNGNNKFEFGYRLFIDFLRLFTDNPQVYIFATSLIMCTGMYIFIERYCKENYCLSILIFMAFIYYSFFSAIRQSMALSIAINSFGYIGDRKWIKAILLILLGGSFHYTALLLLAFIPFTFTQWTKRKIILALLGSVAVAFMFNRLVELVIGMFPIYDRYWNSDMMQAEKANSGTFVALITALCIFSLINLIIKKERFTKQQERSYYIAALIGTIFCITINILGMNQGIFSRMTRYFIPFVMVLTVSTCKYYIKKYLPIFCLGMAFLMGVYFYVKMNSNIYQIIPYRFFFE